MSKRTKEPLTTDAPGGDIVIYRAAGGEPGLEVRLEQDTVWLTQKQVAGLFSTERSVVTKHFRNIFNSKELDEKSVCAIFAHTAADGNKRIASLLFLYFLEKNDYLLRDNREKKINDNTIDEGRSMRDGGRAGGQVRRIPLTNGENVHML